MSLKKLAASIIAASPMLFAAPVGAADLYGEPLPRRYSGYEYETPPVVREEREEFVERHERRDYPVPPRPIYGSVKDGPGYYEPVPPPAHYSCVPRELIRDRLVGEGWRDFSDPEIRDGVALLRARRPSGEPYLLKIDRCSGQVVHVHPLHGGYGPYAWNPRRYAPRPYY